jgi:hypothetical protein
LIEGGACELEDELVDAFFQQAADLFHRGGSIGDAGGALAAKKEIVGSAADSIAGFR